VVRLARIKIGMSNGGKFVTCQLSHECNTSRVKMPKHIKKSTSVEQRPLPALRLSRADYLECGDWRWY